MEEREHPLVELSSHLDQEVAAADEVELQERWSPDHVLF